MEADMGGWNIPDEPSGFGRPSPSGWGSYTASLTPDQVEKVVQSTVEELSSLPLAVLRDREELSKRSWATAQNALRNLGLPHPSPEQMQSIVAQTLARVSGLGFLEPYIPPGPLSEGVTDILLNGDGTVWIRKKGSIGFEKQDVQPTREEAWRAVDALLAPQGKACTEATPSVDARLPRDKEKGFGGARVKVLHPSVCPGDGYPSIAIRLYEPKPVPPERILEWGVMPRFVMESLLEAVSRRLRFMVIGGTSVGKTTLLSALLHGIPQDARIVKVEDPEEIWIPHPNVTTIEARPSPPGSTVPSYTVADGVDDALRLAPTHIIVGEARDGRTFLSLFRALMSDHAGGTTFHATSPEEAVFRATVVMFADAGVRMEPAKALFERAIDFVVQVGWVGDTRRAIGVWEVAGLSGGNVKFRKLWTMGDSAIGQFSRTRGG